MEADVAMRRRPSEPSLFADLDPGAIVRCHSGTVIVTGRLRGGYMARLYDEELHREVSEPIWFAPTTRVLEVIAGPERYAARGVARSDEVDPLLREGAGG